MNEPVPFEHYKKMKGRVKELVRSQQEKELATAELPDELKAKIAEEYKRLCLAHPEWKAHRAMRKAGEKFNVKFDIQ